MTALFDPARPLAMLAACPAYAASPLVEAAWQKHPVWVKDETARMGLGAFKALGGVYAVARVVAELVGDVAPEAMQTPEVAAVAQDIVFVCASAGNHGMSVAAGARLFGARARIYLAETVPEGFAARLAAKGAEVVREGADYEESVGAAIADADRTGAIHIADGSWEGYTHLPRLIMEGYTVIAEECRDTFRARGRWPDRVYLQAGVGGLAAAMAERIRADWDVQPEIVVVEPEAAPCLKASVAAGRIVTVEGPVSEMGRLDCKTASLLAYEVLRECADRFVAVSEDEAAEAVAAARDMGFGTTPSGAAGLAALMGEVQGANAPMVILSEGTGDG